MIFCHFDEYRQLLMIFKQQNVDEPIECDPITNTDIPAAAEAAESEEAPLTQSPQSGGATIRKSNYKKGN